MGFGHPWFDDTYLLRFCFARKFDLQKTIEMWSEFIGFRREYDVDNAIISYETEI